jgi:cytochrome c peroxidase
MKMKKIIIFLAGLLFAGNLIKPIPETIEYNKQKALLGKLLFFDTNLSIDRTISCASCHIPKFGWADPRKVSIGVYGKKGNIQSPTVLNSVFNFKQFWNGRAKDLKEQMNGPFHNPVEMGMSNKLLIIRVKENKKYVKLFKTLYHTDKITYDMIVDAIAEFEKALITPDSKFDLYLKGKIKLSPMEKNGFLVFKKYGCVTCHNGVNVGGNSFQKMGVIFPLKECRGDRYEITHNPLDRCVYKVPSLRNIALTAPYFHNGEAKDLKEAIKLMAKKNLGINFTENEEKALEAFLKTLTGKTPEIMRDEK